MLRKRFQDTQVHLTQKLAFKKWKQNYQENN